MKNWKLHLFWAGVTFVLTAAAGHLLARQEWKAFEPREKDYQARIAQLESALARAKGTPAGTTDPTAPPDVEPDAAGSGPGQDAESPPGKNPRPAAGMRNPPVTAEQIRAWIRAGDLRTCRRAAFSIAKLENTDLEVSLVRELFAVGYREVMAPALYIGDESRWPPEAADLWAVFLREAPKSDQRVDAAVKLGRLGNPAAIPALEQAFRDDTLEVQFAAARSLERLGRAGAREEMIDRLGRMLDDPDGALREDAAIYLGQMRSASVLPHLARALEDRNSDVRWRAVQGLEKTRLKEAIPFLERTLMDPHPAIARRARTAIEHIKKSGPRK